MRAEKAIRIYVRGCSYTVDRGKGPQAFAGWRLVDFGVATATFGGCLPVGNNQGHGGGIKAVKIRECIDRNGKPSPCFITIYLENGEG